MTLAETQRALAALVRGDAVPTSNDPYFAAVAASQGLVVTRDVITRWRDLLIREQCPLTAALLLRLARHAALLARLGQGEVPLFADELACAFLELLRDDDDPLVAAVAGYERALLALGAGTAGPYEITWPCDPAETIARLERGVDLDGVEQGEFIVTLAAD
jgi:hypothetical protein